jgi:hypothetical protein
VFSPLFHPLCCCNRPVFQTHCFLTPPYVTSLYLLLAQSQTLFSPSLYSDKTALPRAIGFFYCCPYSYWFIQSPCSDWLSCL